MCTSVTVSSLCAFQHFPSVTQNFVLATNQFVKKSTCEELQLSTTIHFCRNGTQNGEESGFELPLLVTLGETWLPSLPLLLLLLLSGMPPVDSNDVFYCSDLLTHSTYPVDVAYFLRIKGFGC